MTRRNAVAKRSISVRFAGALSFALGCVSHTQAPAPQPGPARPSAEAPPEPAKPSAEEPVATEPAAQATPDAQPAVADAPAPEGRPLFKDCVLHAGEVHTSGGTTVRKSGKPGPRSSSAACSFNAECIQHHGEDTPNDGFVELDCKEARCECVLQPSAPHAPSTRWTFTLDAPCASGERAESLIVERCMLGMELAPRGLRRAKKGQ